MAVKLRKIIHLPQVVYVEQYRRQLDLSWLLNLEYIDLNWFTRRCKNRREINDSLIADKDCADICWRCGVALHYWEHWVAHVWVYYQQICSKSLCIQCLSSKGTVSPWRKDGFGCLFVSKVGDRGVISDWVAHIESGEVQLHLHLSQRWPVICYSEVSKDGFVSVALRLKGEVEALLSDGQHA